MADGRREIRILNFAVSIASKNKNIEIEEFRELRILERFFLEVLRCTGHTDRLRRSPRMSSV